jgi:hypothetical protein
MKQRVVALMVLLAGAVVASASSCGSDGGGDADGAIDGTLNDGGGVDSPGFTDGNGNDSTVSNDAGDGGCGWNTCTTDGGQQNCLNLGTACKQSSECCSGNCLNGACQPPTCVSDNQSCTNNAQCCSGTCTTGTCTPLNTTCKTLGNSCTASSQCCSMFCENGICAQPSYCGQFGDICAKPADCCGGICTIQSGHTFGTCGQPQQTGAQCSAIDGVVCSATDAGLTDSGLPACGGDCCSRDCAPWGPTQVFICQPASGCKPVGDICTKDSDCCGGLPTNSQPPAPPGVCNFTGDSGVGVCANPSGCKPNGDICRLQTNQCNATDKCCSGNVQQLDTCKQDNLGVPRCSGGGDGGCVPSTGQCASSADCCNLNPCVPDGDGGFTCYPGACVPTSGACTTDADCCVGGHCYIQGGQTTGTCQPLTDGGTTSSDGGTVDSGTPCALYGQLCTTSGDCCNNVPCTNGRCEVPIN